jgi:hypothetical protein
LKIINLETLNLSHETATYLFCKEESATLKNVADAESVISLHELHKKYFFSAEPQTNKSK